MQGGAARDWFVEVDETGSRPMSGTDGSIGCHQGRYSVLNVMNPQAGWEYSWIRNRPDEILSAKMRGTVIVNDTDPEYTSLSDYTGLDQAAPLDTRTVFGDVVLGRTPIEVERVRRDELLEQSRKSLQNPVNAFVSNASETERELAGRKGLASLRYAMAQHQTDYQADGRTERLEDVGKGIIRDK